MSTDDSVNDARSEKWDPLTAPVWDLSDVDEPTLAPPIEQFMPVDEDTIIRRRPPLPPDADEIIRGEYTGWVPLIKSGETLDQAKAREENRVSSFETAIPNVDANAWAPIEVVASDESEFVAPDDLASDVSSSVREPVVEVRPYAFPSEIVPDPDFVVSPAEALEEARRRIAQMRASLQTNINRVSFQLPLSKNLNHLIRCLRQMQLLNHRHHNQPSRQVQQCIKSRYELKLVKSHAFTLNQHNKRHRQSLLMKLQKKLIHLNL